MDRTEDPTIEDTTPADVPSTDDAADRSIEIVEELVEEISIDGMCGVY
ncbi:MAG: mycofactocin precursor MftA [Ilumatobacter sp.]